LRKDFAKVSREIFASQGVHVGMKGSSAFPVLSNCVDPPGNQYRRALEVISLKILPHTFSGGEMILCEAEKRMKVYFSCIIIYIGRLSREVASTSQHTSICDGMDVARRESVV
jgi:hypothetical protein